MSEAQRDAVWQELPARLSTLSARVRLLPWTRDEVVNWVRDTIAARQGTWVVGDAGAAAEFPGSTHSELNLYTEPGSIVARAPDASFRLRVNEKVRAFAFNGGDRLFWACLKDVRRCVHSRLYGRSAVMPTRSMRTEKAKNSLIWASDIKAADFVSAPVTKLLDLCSPHTPAVPGGKLFRRSASSSFQRARAVSSKARRRVSKCSEKFFGRTTNPRPAPTRTSCPNS